ncbi:MAG: CoB--CoM heterodisulfide reductase iron-sulfur subunit B family protein [Chlorobium sp.]|jgi:succinate dehydrogenase / fumarate reductase cytochrome b subunit|uniref:CoB--CoM heterodisulfide reductase iron-sulfur subunit B family protein n=1 Tax=Chlorobium sp. TaxID=1095 RepID=UPI001D713EB5|nr:CoB--CoM heterodisulfide reductase iron-sulfur subunit B family protein [Chlorobium sp.]MBN1279286.1 CoB--CoM heterodisulfide reductase iron-sulfur subunit B family protein [Chlorobiaceae bacterium]MCF8217094.1 CoB--CoM heterodisulfide reductase iron-sulfur subunit B family protein [Chlorobium sp.]MCF8271940.1 CoB--CoM heterodisulfide reductase iron-sulfur subunit B family protein [Chlorobium sp.]MCF8288311.1 CoB--CoM heterodisulfide reductase iron-sulfur subunit B family protein [Chlorobium
MKRYAYYLSCINESMTKEVDRSIDLWQKDLGIELVKLHESTCCGGSNLEYVSPKHFALVNARNIALAEKLGLDLIVSCNTCLMTIRTAKKKLDESPELRKEVNELLKKDGLEYKGTSNVRHLLWVLADDIGFDAIREKVKVPLKNFRIAPFYGCHILRPSTVLGKDDPLDPTTLDQLIEALGGTTLPYEHKNRCCGFHTLLVAEEESLNVAAEALKDAIDISADFIVTPCPLCHTVLDGYQSKALRQANIQKSIPVFHLSEMVGLALGYTEKQLGIKRHIVS